MVGGVGGVVDGLVKEIVLKYEVKLLLRVYGMRRVLKFSSW